MVLLLFMMLLLFMVLYFFGLLLVLLLCSRNLFLVMLLFFEFVLGIMPSGCLGEFRAGCSTRSSIAFITMDSQVNCV